ncbi:site-specific recombinase, phage integrase family protein [Rhodovulum sulfidophilum]|uniref:Site-specific recombinase, phage integrase family protein n=1 Tax=Rhodovulum sulfidophilum TaxID=35806 RepID=A0A0D6B3T0_RHOSU|nr:site-specific recombinase, phage integrase family protein [Rhodovulum sulfidophilum]
MGTITARPRKGGTISYRVQIVIRRKRATVFSIVQTFESETAARRRLQKKETKLKTPEGLERALLRKSGKGFISLIQRDSWMA